MTTLRAICTAFAPESLERYPHLPTARSSAPSKTVAAAMTDRASRSAPAVGGTPASIIPVATATVPRASRIKLRSGDTTTWSNSSPGRIFSSP